MHALRCTFDHNNARLHGGGIFGSEDTTLFVNQSQFYANQAQRHGGGILSLGVARVTRSHFASNRAQSGGAIAGWTGARQISVIGSSFVGNVADGAGAGISIGAKGSRGALPTLTVLHSKFIANEAKVGSGGAINIQRTDFHIAKSHFTNNTSPGNGGGAISCAFVMTRAPEIIPFPSEIVECEVRNNRAATGGGLRAYECNYTVRSSIMHGNHATGAGGALTIDANAMVIVKDGTTITGNTCVHA